MSDFAERIAKLSPEKLALLAARRTAEPIAVTGIGCRLPGDASSPSAFWDLLLAGRDAIEEVPAERWNAAALYDPDATVPGKMATRWGGFLRGIDLFDAEFFDITNREAARMDPQQRLLLETAWEALEDAGLTMPVLAGSETGVFVGVHSLSSEYYIGQLHDRADIDAYTSTGGAHSIVANRLSYWLDLHGPSLAVDTACSSSLVAVHLAVTSLQNEECDLAIAAGVNLVLSPETTITFSRLQMMAADGRCKTFDARADGFVRGEGCGAVVLKRLADALRDGDPIYALIRGSATNQDGRTNGLTAPNGLAQQQVIRRALRRAKVAPAQIQYVETHGTGTAMGDPIEVEALNAVLGTGPGRVPCVLGSVKSNIGHLEGASGIAGLIKAVLCLHHERIPRQLHYDRANPHLRLEATPFVIPVDTLDWPRGAEPRRAGVSSFGFGGTNAHIVLEEAPAAVRASGASAAARSRRRRQVLPVAARSAAALAALANRYAELLEHGAEMFADVCFTAATRRTHHRERLAVVADDAAAAARLLRARAAATPGGAAPSRASGPQVKHKAVWLFADEGVHDLQAHRQLHEAEPVYARTVAEIDRALAEHGAQPMLAAAACEAGTAPDAAVVLFALQAGLAAVFRDYGLEPHAVAGHGAGELAAAYAAGALTLADAVAVLTRAHDRGSVAAQGAPFKRVPLYLASRGGLVRDERIDAVSWRQAASMQTRGDGPVRAALQATDACVLAFPSPREPSAVDVGAVCAAVVPALAPDRGDVLDALVELYSLGADIRWSALFSDGGRVVRLPRYPWQRRRHWFEPRGGGAQAATTAEPAGGADEPAEWCYEIAWELDSPHGRRPISRPAALPAADRLAREIEPRVRAAFDAHSGEAAGVLEELEAISVAYAAEALRRLDGAANGAHHRAPHAQRLVEALVAMLERAEALERNGDDRRRGSTAPAEPAAQRMASLRRRLGDAEPVSGLLERCGPQIADVVTGRRDALTLLFPAEDGASATDIYTRTPFARVANGLVADALAAALRDLPATATLRVLELGAGTGGTTRVVLPLLPSERTEYVFTDVSRLFLDKARAAFADRPFVRYGLLDIETHPAQQGFGAEQFDVVIAVNVLHATRDLRTALDHVHELLSPGGLLVLVEGTAQRNWVDLTFGLTEGWWRFTDRDLRKNHPLLDAPAWRRLLADLGFASAVVVPAQPAGRTSLFDQGIVLATKVSEPRLHVRAEIPEGSEPWLLLADATGVADAVAERLRAGGRRCLLARPEEASREVGPDELRYDACEPERLPVLLERIAARDGRALGAIVNLLACEDAATGGSAASWQASLERSYGTTLALLHGIERSGCTVREGVWIVSRGSQPLLGAIGAEALAQAPLWGLGRVAALEVPDVWGGCIDLESGVDVERDTAQILAGIGARDGEAQIAFRSGDRFTARLVRKAIDVGTELELDAEGGYLITGGLGGVGMETAHWLVEKGARHLVLLGRKGLERSGSPAERALIEAAVHVLERAGAHVEIVAADVAQRGALESIVQRFGRDLPPLRGVFHAAGIVRAAPLGVSNMAGFRDHCRAKVAGAWNLHALTRELELDYFVLFASAVGVIGIEGLVHHAAVNNFMDALAHFRRAQGLPGLSVDWGWWSGRGAPTEADQRLFRQIGLRSMSPAAAFRGLSGWIASGVAQGTVAAIDWSVLAPLYTRRTGSGYFRRLAPLHVADAPAVSAPAASATAAAPPSLAERVASAAPSEAWQILEGAIRQIVAEILDADEAHLVGTSEGFFQLGMDSIMTVELRNRLEAALSCRLPTTLALEYPTVRKLTQYIGEQILGLPQGAAQAREPRPSAATAPATDLDALSEEELAAMLDDDIARYDGEV